MKTDNQLIAEFIGVGRCTDKGHEHDPCFYYESEGGYITSERMKYNSSWDWLMPVVEKISQHIYESYPEKLPDGHTTVMQHDRAYIRTFGMLDDEGQFMIRINRQALFRGATLIEATYKAVVEFIKFYNE